MFGGYISVDLHPDKPHEITRLQNCLYKLLKVQFTPQNKPNNVFKALTSGELYGLVQEPTRDYMVFATDQPTSIAAFWTGNHL